MNTAPHTRTGRRRPSPATPRVRPDGDPHGAHALRVRDEHALQIRGALGTIALGEAESRRPASRRLRTMLAILGPGLIVMVADNDAGAFSTYTQAGQNYGTRLLWTLLLLIPILYVNQEMVLRLGAVTGVGHAKLIMARFGRFWGAFSVIDLFMLNALTIVTEFIGIALACRYLGLPKAPTIALAGVLVIGAASTGSFQRFERLCLALVAGSLVLVPVYVLVHPPTAQMAQGLFVPGLPGGHGLSTVMLLIIAIVGTTIAPWQLFFQQSYVIDKRITTRFIRYERADLVLGIALVVIGAAAMIGFSAAAFAGRAGFGHFTDAAGVAAGLARFGSHAAGVLFSIGLIDASVIGAAAVGLATAYAAGDALGVDHSLHRSVRGAKGFYGCYAALISLAAALVLIPGVPLGTLTEGVQTLAGVLLPSATVFLLLLCNDREVLGPWANSTATNVLTGAVVWVLVLLSVILTAGVLFPRIGWGAILTILIGGAAVGCAGGLWLAGAARRGRAQAAPEDGTRSRARLRAQRAYWRMPPLEELGAPVLSLQRRLGLATLRGYLLLAVALVVVKLVTVSA